MKYLFLILLICFQAGASNWAPLSKIQSQSLQGYQLKADCEKSGEQCLDIGDEPAALSQGFITLEDDWSGKTEIESCIDETDCQSKLGAKTCTIGQKFINETFTEVYCTLLIGKKIVLDSVGLASYKTTQAQIAAFNGAKAAAKKLRECGQGVMDLLLVRNAAKQPTLTTAQVKQIVSVYAPIKGLLETGSLASAKEEVQAITPDGTLITDGDKTAIVGAIDSCLGGN